MKKPTVGEMLQKELVSIALCKSHIWHLKHVARHQSLIRDQDLTIEDIIWEAITITYRNSNRYQRLFRPRAADEAWQRLYGTRSRRRRRSPAKRPVKPRKRAK